MSYAGPLHPTIFGNVTEEGYEVTRAGSSASSFTVEVSQSPPASHCKEPWEEAVRVFCYS
jgi:hypothetical protein